MYLGEQTNTAGKHIPFEWIGDVVLVQRFNALRLISLVQLVYAITAYALTFIWGWTNSVLYVHDYKIYIQAFSGISMISIIAGLLMRVRLDGAKSLLQVKIYIGLMVLELLLWGARMVYIIHYYTEHNFDFPYQTYFNSTIYNFFVLLLLLVGMSVAARVIHRATKQQYSLLSNGHEDSPSFRLALHFYPLRLLSFIQITYVVAASMVVFMSPSVETYDVGVFLLVTPAAGFLTIASGLLTFFCLQCGKSLPTIYAILQTVDLVTGVLRVVGGVLYIVLWINRSSQDPLENRQIIATVCVSTAFPVFYWVMGIITAYRTRVHINMDSAISNEDADSVHGI